jgi:hypothetical protein
MSIIVKDANSVDRYYEAVGDGSSSNPFQSVVPDFKLAHAIKSISDTYSDTVDIWEKGKVLNKFGYNPDLDTGVAETIWNQGGDETLKTANDIDIIVSTNAGDTQDVVIEGHTISGSDLTFVTQTATLNGTTNVSLTTPLARVTRVYNDDSTDFAGDITVEDNGTSVHAKVSGSTGQNQTKKCQTATSSVDYWIITSLSGGVVGSVSATVQFELQVKLSGKVWRTLYDFNSSNYTQIDLSTYIIVPPNSDIRIIGTSGTNNTEAVASIEGYLAIIT